MQVKILNSIDADSSPQMFKWLQSIKELSNGNVKTMKIVSEVTTRKEDSFVVITTFKYVFEDIHQGRGSGLVLNYTYSRTHYQHLEETFSTKIFNLTGFTQVSMTNFFILSSAFISRVVAQFMDDDAGRHGHVEAVQGGVRGEARGHHHALGGAGEEVGGDAGTLATQH